MRQHLTTAVLVATLVAGAGGLSACSASSATSAASTAPSNGVSTEPGAEVLTAALAAVESQSSVRMVVKGTRDSLPYAVDMRIRRAGGASGSVWIGSERLSIVTTRTDVFVQADEKYWSTIMAANYAKAIGTMWVKAPLTSADFAAYALFGNYEALLGNALRTTGAATRGDVATVVSTPAVPVVSAQGSVWVATTGAPLPVQVEDPTTGDVTRYGEWGTTVDVPVPSAAQTVDLGAIGVAR